MVKFTQGVSQEVKLHPIHIMINQETYGQEEAQSSFAAALQTIEKKYGITTTDLGSQKEKIRKSIDAEIEQLLTENFRIPAAVLMAKINEISRMFKPMELQYAHSMVADIQAGKRVGNFNDLMMQMSMFDGGGSNKGGHDRSTRLKAEFFILLILLSFWIASCAPPLIGVGPVVPVNEAGTPISVLVQPAEATSTKMPATETAAPTEVVIPDWANPFFEGGFDSKVPSRPNSEYMIIRDGMRKSFDNLIINGLRIIDVTYGVGYIENGVFHDDGIIINTAVREVRPGSFWTSISGASSVRISAGIPSTVWIEGIMRGLDDALPGDSDIIVALLGQGHENQGDRDKIFGDFFEGNIVIPGVQGKVLKVQNYFFDAYEQH